ncbi:uncharacterized protein KY384_001938 [Bacidia gigantensis]|uniref:uncharacterized protein n=1 Tax=Bacidia gigantensis TaxID=2732470 RepID=UPI001D038E9E|nr:uncharacterized protein KY384_001938 [Bacidia gigantensis]KAG8533155.1 hypothetical protein KY384_001938 [Bacidia gigantensis]
MSISGQHYHSQPYNDTIRPATAGNKALSQVVQPIPERCSNTKHLIAPQPSTRISNKRRNQMAKTPEQNSMWKYVDEFIDFTTLKSHPPSHKHQSSEASERHPDSSISQQQQESKKAQHAQHPSLASEIKFLFKSFASSNEAKDSGVRQNADHNRVASIGRAEKAATTTNSYLAPSSQAFPTPAIEEPRPVVTRPQKNILPVPPKAIARKPVPQHLEEQPSYKSSPHHAVKLSSSPVHQSSVKGQQTMPSGNRYKRPKERSNSILKSRATQLGDFMKSTFLESPPQMPPIPPITERQSSKITHTESASSGRTSRPDWRCHKCEKESDFDFNWHPTKSLWLCPTCLYDNPIQVCGFCGRVPESGLQRHPIHDKVFLCPTCYEPESPVQIAPSPLAPTTGPRKPLPLNASHIPSKSDETPRPQITQSLIRRHHSPLSLISRQKPNRQSYPPYSSDDRVSPVSKRSSWETDVPDQDEPSTPTPSEPDILPLSKAHTNGRETASTLPPVLMMSPLVKAKRVASSVYPEDEIAMSRSDIMVPVPLIPERYRVGQNVPEHSVGGTKVAEREVEVKGDQRETYYGVLGDYLAN